MEPEQLDVRDVDAVEVAQKIARAAHHDIREIDNETRQEITTAISEAMQENGVSYSAGLAILLHQCLILVAALAPDYTDGVAPKNIQDVIGETLKHFVDDGLRIEVVHVTTPGDGTVPPPGMLQ